MLILYSFGRDFAPFNDFSARFHEDLSRQSPEPIDFYEASLEVARFGDGQQEGPFVDYVDALFAGRRLDLVVTLGGPAASFSQRYRTRLFPSTPLLMTAVDERIIMQTAVTANDTVVAVKFHLPEYIDEILQLLPKTTTIAVVLGNSQLEKFWLEEMRREFRPYARQVKFIWFNELSFDEALKRAATLPPASAIFYWTFSVDADGVPHEQEQALTRLHEAANAPIFSFSDTHLGRGIVGGPLVSNTELSQQAANVAVRLLAGEPPSEIKSPPLRPEKSVFDSRELLRWGINQAQLPPGSEVLFRESTAWEQYRMQIVALGAVLAVQIAMIAWLLYEHQRRRKAEAVARNTLSELAHINRIATAGELSGSIAHEVKQPLAAMITRANAGLRWLARAPPDLEEARAAFKEIVSSGHNASNVIDSIRGMFRKEHPQGTRVPLDVNDLIRQVLLLVHDELLKHEVSFQAELSRYLPTIMGDRVQLQQVILNLVKNAVEAMSSVTDRERVLRIKTQTHESGSVLVSIEDTGTGIDAKDMDRIFSSLFTTKSEGMGLGLAICRTIIEAHGGRVWALSDLSYGSTFQFVLPTGRPESEF